MATPARIWAVLDRIAHPSTRGHDLEGSIAGLRRLLGAQTPSQILAQPAPAPRPKRQRHVSFDQLREAQEAARLAEQALAKASDKLADAKITNRKLEGELAAARGEIARLQATQNDTGDGVPYHPDVWRTKLAAFLQAHPDEWRLTTGELLAVVDAPLTIGDAKRLTAIMADLGWQQTTNVPSGERRTRGYVRVSEFRTRAA